MLVSELIREKVLHYLNDEVPHGVAVEVERMKSRQDKDIVDISAVIYCERDSHKGIIIGKNGRKLKGIGKSAREDRISSKSSIMGKSKRELEKSTKLYN